MGIKFVTAEDGTVYAVDTDVETTVVIEKSGGDGPPIVSGSPGPETVPGSDGNPGGKGGGHGHRSSGSGDEPPPPKIYEVVIHSVVQTKPHSKGTWWRLSVSRDGEPGFFNMVFPAGWPESKIRERAKYILERFPDAFDPSVA